MLTVIVGMRMTSHTPLGNEGVPFVPPQVIWFPHNNEGGGSDRGGAHAIEPPRPVRAIGSDSISVPATPPQQASTDSRVEPPEDVSAIPAKPLGDATQMLIGAIDSTGTSDGPGDAGAGTSPGANDGGPGRGPGDGFGTGAISGGPGVTLPTPIVRATPKYTVDAMRARVQGVAIIECVVLPDGTVGDARVMRSLDRRFGLDEEAIAAAKR
ncbi:MAG TPA: energy transducer TonB, partial [Vicinamibacterales bacterium]|nr:energy transducer TonB [Vicinamibacterales bacterium]